jgi:hypothetical protein
LRSELLDGTPVNRGHGKSAQAVSRLSLADEGIRIPRQIALRKQPAQGAGI